MSSSALVGLLMVLACAGCPMGGQGGDCETNAECASSEVCARDHACVAPSTVREVTVTWTVNGSDASSVSCGAQDSFTLTFFADDIGDELGFTPVPCAAGQFFVDRLPRRFHSVEIGIGGRRVPIDANGTATGDLVP